MPVAAGGHRDNGAVAEHVERMGQHPAIFGIDRPTIDDKGLADRVVIGPHRPDRQGGADQDVEPFEQGADGLVHGVLHIPRPGNLVRGHAGRKIGHRQRVICQKVAMLGRGPQGLAPEMHGPVPGHRGPVDFRGPADLDLLHMTAGAGKDLQRTGGVGAHVAFHGDIAQIHRPADAQGAGGGGPGQGDLVAQGGVVAVMRARDQVLHEHGVAHGAGQHSAVVVGVDVGGQAIRVAAMRRLVADQSAGAGRNTDRAADICAGGHGRHPCRQSRSRPAGRSSGAVVGVERVARHSPHPRIAYARQAELRRGGAGMQDGAGRLHPLDRRVRDSIDMVLKHQGALGRALARDALGVLHRDGQPFQRARRR